MYITIVFVELSGPPFVIVYTKSKERKLWMMQVIITNTCVVFKSGSVR